MTDDDRDTIARALAVADILDAEARSFGGIIRQVCRLAATAADRSPGADGCPECGAAIEQPSLGRRREFCTACRPPRPRKSA